jgi:hypothetical protein
MGAGPGAPAHPARIEYHISPVQEMLPRGIRHCHNLVADCHRTVARRHGRAPLQMRTIEETMKGAAIMSLANHLDELQRKHGDIERQIDEALTHPSVDDLEIVSLKRRKLAIKDEIEKLRHTTH